MEILEEKLWPYINSIKLSVSNQNWLSALSLTLMLPDICGKLESPGLKTGKRYKKWFRENLSDLYSFVNLTDNDAYALRCAYIHAGEMDISIIETSKTLEKFLFMEPKIIDRQYVGSHLVRINSVMVLRIDAFCEEYCQAVLKWIEKNKDNLEINKRGSNIGRIYSSGINIGGVRIE